ncbi:MAG TPA: hypothetical protein VFL60_10100 [Gaiellaceae bacterium]|nr:hypothetical protein [Gaiellaceae bacterium]
MAVRTDEIAFLDLGQDPTTTVPPDGPSDVEFLHSSGAMVEVHRDWMEAAAAIGTGLILQLAHPRDQLSLSRALLGDSDLPRRGVIRVVVRLSAPFVVSLDNCPDDEETPGPA